MKYNQPHNETDPNATYKDFNLDTGEANIYAKLESFNPMSSAKDRASIYQPATAVSTAVLTLNSSGNERWKREI